MPLAGTSLALGGICLDTLGLSVPSLGGSSKQWWRCVFPEDALDVRAVLQESRQVLHKRGTCGPEFSCDMTYYDPRTRTNQPEHLCK